jgi:ABC-type sugar transport system substrate-binding protein
MKKRIGFSISRLGNPFWIEVVEGTQRALPSDIELIIKDASEDISR